MMEVANRRAVRFVCSAPCAHANDPTQGKCSSTSNWIAD